MRVNEISGIVVDAALKVHTALGPGLLEGVYEKCLAYELRKRGFCVEQEVALPIIYDGLRVDGGLRIDLLVENCIVVELKAVEAFNPIHEVQLLTYLKLSGKPVGLLINFNVIRLREGIKRIVNHAPDLTPPKEPS